MKEKRIYELLERYWQCETSCEEEQELLAFFSEDTDVLPEDLKIYQSLFGYVAKQTEIKADKKLKKSIREPFTVQLYPFLKMAASVVIAVTIGIGIYTHYQQEKWMDTMFTETYVDPQDAMAETEQVLVKVSSLLQLAGEQQAMKHIQDSLAMSGLELTEEFVEEDTISE